MRPAPARSTNEQDADVTRHQRPEPTSAPDARLPHASPGTSTFRPLIERLHRTRWLQEPLPAIFCCASAIAAFRACTWCPSASPTALLTARVTAGCTFPAAECG